MVSVKVEAERRPFPILCFELYTEGGDRFNL